MMLREAKSKCDHLIAAIQTDPTIDRPEKNRPVQTIVERYIQLSAVKYVDEIIVYTTEQDLEDILEMYPIDIRVLGEEYRDKDFTGRKECTARSIEIIFNGRDHSFSSSNLRKRVAEAERNKDGTVNK
jgi:glycerol-3-phosphate cytidylyltransferase